MCTTAGGETTPFLTSPPMARTTGGDGGEDSAVSRSWLSRTVAAVFLGAGLYAGLAIAGEVAAHADETAATATQAEQTPGSEPTAADPTATTTATDQSAPPPAE